VDQDSVPLKEKKEQKRSVHFNMLILTHGIFVW